MLKGFEFKSEGALVCGTCCAVDAESAHKKCSACGIFVCVACLDLFHNKTQFSQEPYASSEGQSVGCIRWPLRGSAARKAFLWELKHGKSLEAFINFLARSPFAQVEGRVYIAITAQQRGDFHKLKWSIASNPHLYVLLPLHEDYSREWVADILGRAEAMDFVAEGRWDFIHSSKFVSSRDTSAKKGVKEEISTKKSGTTKMQLSSIGTTHFKKIALGAVKKDDEATRNEFETWAKSVDTCHKVYNIDTIVPLFNSPLVRDSRSEWLNTYKFEGLDEVFGKLFETVKGCEVLVLWGSRTDGKRGYLVPQTGAREFRHKTSKALVRLLSSAAAEVKKVRILAGDPLEGVDCDFDLTELWDLNKVSKTWNAKRAFNRIEQEYLFYRLAVLAKNTLHIGMQSGNIEPLINNLNTNVMCVNENTPGGAGLDNVERISGFRESLVLRRKLKEATNLYLSYSLETLPSALGEFSRMLMERYKESVSVGRGLQRYVNDLGRLKNAKKEPQSKPLIDVIGGLCDERTEPRGISLLSKHAPQGEALERELFLRMSHKILRGKEKTIKKKTKTIVAFEDLKPEIQLLCLVVQSGHPNVQFIIRGLNQVQTRKVQDRRYFWCKVVVDFILSQQLHKGKGAFSSTTESEGQKVSGGNKASAGGAGRGIDHGHLWGRGHGRGVGRGFDRHSAPSPGLGRGHGSVVGLVDGRSRGLGLGQSPTRGFGGGYELTHSNIITQHDVEKPGGLPTDMFERAALLVMQLKGHAKTQEQKVLHAQLAHMIEFAEPPPQGWLLKGAPLNELKFDRRKALLEELNKLKKLFALEHECSENRGEINEVKRACNVLQIPWDTKSEQGKSTSRVGSKVRVAEHYYDLVGEVVYIADGIYGQRFIIYVSHCYARGTCVDFKREGFDPRSIVASVIARDEAHVTLHK